MLDAWYKKELYNPEVDALEGILSILEPEGLGNLECEIQSWGLGYDENKAEKQDLPNLPESNCKLYIKLLYYII